MVGFMWGIVVAWLMAAVYFFVMRNTDDDIVSNGAMVFAGLLIIIALTFTIGSLGASQSGQAPLTPTPLLER